MRVVHKAAAVALALVLSLGAIGVAKAALVLAVSLEQLVQSSDQVVHGEALHSVSRWDERGRIVTDVRIRVVDRLHISGREQPLLEEIEVRFLGGEIGELAMQVPGEPSLEVGDEAVVFVRWSANNHLRPVGMSQGVVRVQQTSDGKTVRLRQGAELVRRGPEGLEEAAPPIANGTALSSLIERVRDLSRGLRR